jgi:hypothetical protein
MKTFKQFYEADQHPRAFHGQTYGDNDGQYKVEEIDAYAKEHYPDVIAVPVADLEHQLKPTKYETHDEVPGSDEFAARAKMATFEHPVLVVRYRDDKSGHELWIADGSHRVWKAKQAGMKTIDAYVIPSDELRNLPTKLPPWDPDKEWEDDEDV